MYPNNPSEFLELGKTNLSSSAGAGQFFSMLLQVEVHIQPLCLWVPCYVHEVPMVKPLHSWGFKGQDLLIRWPFLPHSHITFSYDPLIERTNMISSGIKFQNSISHSI